MYPHWKPLRPSHCVYHLVMGALETWETYQYLFYGWRKGRNFMSRYDYVAGRYGYTLTSTEQSSKRNLHFLWQRIHSDIYPTFRQTKQAFRVTNDTYWHLSIGLANKTKNISYASGNVGHLDNSPGNRKRISCDTVTIYFVCNNCHPHSHYNDQSGNNV